ncbi:MAG: AbrB/MazE/SpoVT family DNA-binding domain-containing protein [Bacillota bacterium]|nr:AbrB/MazE/SpoVT family DNA-binding domain-containing protein [Bacillota bacterium]MDD3298603.1 AbrB/MazE/SpoVT family DNA-binding domain-containing protein [Bacillota bacterium]MDD3850944.1 AbrB/MazE/SpoVT family DNA-binding domain-containing protein [Bacillota bacterium]MDD4708051.1 AbrB/MazE/SpoVT family DNA-binding domain-containing protein [Bacillota bacterium]
MTTPKSYKVSVKRRNLITLPKEVRKELKISEGDMLDVRISENKIIMEPYKLVPSSQAYFWNKKTQEDILEAREDVKAGRVREVSSINEFLEGMEDD